MSSGMGIALIVIGAVLRFAVTARSPHGLNLHVVGVILMLAGLLGLLLPYFARLSRDRGRRPVNPGSSAPDVQARINEGRPGYDDRPAVQDNRRAR